MKILFIGDVVGRAGRAAVAGVLPSLIQKDSIDFVIVNAENAAGGYGLTTATALELLRAGADCLTSGNHIWAQREAYELLEQDRRVLRPANYPEDAPGGGAQIYRTSAGSSVGVINLLGRVFMDPVDCPFRRAQEEIEQMTGHADLIVVDFHAEATSEKQAMGYFLDGQVSAVVGTHTHVQTSDERILEGGTAYITDCGMTGPSDTVIGVDKQIVVETFLTRLPQRFAVPKSGPCVISGVMIQCNRQNGLAQAITRISLSYPDLPSG